PDGNMQMDEVLSDPDKVAALLNSCYDKIPLKGYQYYFLDNLVVLASDDGYTSDEGQGVISTYYYMDQNSASRHWLTSGPDTEGANNAFYWTHSWQQIRLCSQFIELIDKAAVHSENDRARFKAEARILRAFFYM